MNRDQLADLRSNSFAVIASFYERLNSSGETDMSEIAIFQTMVSVHAAAVREMLDSPAPQLSIQAWDNVRIAMEILRAGIDGEPLTNDEVKCAWSHLETATNQGGAV